MNATLTDFALTAGSKNYLVLSTAESAITAFLDSTITASGSANASAPAIIERTLSSLDQFF